MFTGHSQRKSNSLTALGLVIEIKQKSSTRTIRPLPLYQVHGQCFSVQERKPWWPAWRSFIHSNSRWAAGNFLFPHYGLCSSLLDKGLASHTVYFCFTYEAAEAWMPKTFKNASHWSLCLVLCPIQGHIPSKQFRVLRCFKWKWRIGINATTGLRGHYGMTQWVGEVRGLRLQILKITWCSW